MSNMKNIPEKIYLQIGNECDSEDFNELSEVSWCRDKIYDNDIEYTLQNQIDSITEQEIEKLAEDKYPTEDVHKNMFHDNSGQYSRQKAFVEGYKAALQNKVSEKCKREWEEDELANAYVKKRSKDGFQSGKVSDVSAEEILYKHILADSEKQMSGDKRLVIKDPPFEEIIKNPTFQMHVAAMEEYASIVNERKDSAGSSETSNEVLNEVLGIAVKAHLFKQLTQMDDFIEEMKKFENFEIKKK